MNIDELLLAARQLAPQIAASCCVVNGAIMNLDEIERMGYQKFGLRSKLNMPRKLYKYFPNIAKKSDENVINYSMQALKNNTVFMQAPNEFDDVYDSDINVDFSEYERLRLAEYCRRCKIDVHDSLSTLEIGNLLIQSLITEFNQSGSFESAFKEKPTSKIEELSNQSFSLRLNIELHKGNNLGVALSNIIRYDYEEYCSRLKNIFRTSCFATTPYSQLMWGGSYADCHRGFCVEYTVLPEDDNYKGIYQNLFPMIYCKTRPNMAEKLVKLQDKEITEDGLWDIYSHGALRKSIDWSFQNEWRLLLPLQSNNISDYNIKFFPITKVFLGNRMPPKKRAEIIEICIEHNVPYIGVTRNPNIFEMQDCEILCENCPNFKNGLTRGSRKSSKKR